MKREYIQEGKKRSEKKSWSPYLNWGWKKALGIVLGFEGYIKMNEEKKKKRFLQHYYWTFNKILCCMWLFLPPKIVFIWLWHHKETRLYEDQGYDLYMDYCSSHLHNVLDTPFKPPPRHQSDILKIEIWLWQYLV